jgi:predicted ATPase/Tfp pilus assembly protein PilF
MAAARAGQTLISHQARAALGAAAARAQSHGHWRFKGVAEPVEVFEVGDEHAPFLPPSDASKAYSVVHSNGLWVPKLDTPHALPAERDEFVGRGPELRDLHRRFDEGARLVSLIGAGGTGKTRLAVRWGWTWLGEFAGGVWFCDLAPARSLEGIAHAVATTLQVPLGRDDLVEHIGRALAGRGRCVVILDNFEQVAAFAAESLGAWLSLAPEACFIATTRAVLGLRGEQVVGLAPLGASEGATLFVRRAEAAWERFRVLPEDHAAIEDLVRLTEGLPLAIELAAARVRIMSPQMLLARMSERFKLLANAGRGNDRQATLRTTFDWSWDLLSSTEKRALAQLSVFVGGFTLAAAEATLDLGSPATPWVVDLVQALLDKSLLRRLDGDRFGMFQSLQEYAAEHLSSEGRFEGSGTQALADALARHWRYFSSLGERAVLDGGSVDIENLVAACRRATAHGDLACATRALAASWFALQMTGPLQVGLVIAQALADTGRLSPSEGAIAAWVAGRASYLLGDVVSARRWLESALAQVRVHGPEVYEMRILCGWSQLLVSAGELGPARERLDEALGKARTLSEPALECEVLNGLGALEVSEGNATAARTRYQAAVDLASRNGDKRLEGGLLSNLGGLDFEAGNLEQAGRHYERALALVRSVSDKRWEGSARCNLALLHHEQGRSDDARDELEATLRLAKEIGHAELECFVLCNLGIVNEALGNLAHARSHYESAVALAHAIGDPHSEGQFRGYLGLLHARLDRADDARACFDEAELLLRAIGNPMSLALLLCSRGRSAVLAGDRSSAEAALAEAESLVRSLEVSAQSELGRALDVAVRELAAL